MMPLQRGRTLRFSASERVQKNNRFKRVELAAPKTGVNRLVVAYCLISGHDGNYQRSVGATPTQGRKYAERCCSFTRRDGGRRFL
jgi:hypothetical protein